MSLYEMVITENQNTEFELNFNLSLLDKKNRTSGMIALESRLYGSTCISTENIMDRLKKWTSETIKKFEKYHDKIFKYVDGITTWLVHMISGKKIDTQSFDSSALGTVIQCLGLAGAAVIFYLEGVKNNYAQARIQLTERANAGQPNQGTPVAKIMNDTYEKYKRQLTYLDMSGSDYSMNTNTMAYVAKANRNCVSAIRKATAEINKLDPNFNYSSSSPKYYGYRAVAYKGIAISCLFLLIVRLYRPIKSLIKKITKKFKRKKK